MLQLDRNYLQHVSRPFHRKSASLPVHRFAPRSPNVNRLPRRSLSSPGSAGVLFTRLAANAGASSAMFAGPIEQKPFEKELR
jgi:hypothetical protein